MKKKQTVPKEEKYAWVLKQYPDIISSIQLREICHVSPKTAAYLLSTQLIPNIDSGAKTRRYKIRTEDVVKYLYQREQHPEAFKAPDGYYHGKKNKYISNSPCFRKLSSKQVSKFQSLLELKGEELEDVVIVSQLSKTYGISEGRIRSWCKRDLFVHFHISGVLHIPKSEFIHFLASEKGRSEKAYGDYYLWLKKIQPAIRG